MDDKVEKVEEYSECYVPNSSGPDCKFLGVLVAEAYCPVERLKLRIFRTKAGNIVCSSVSTAGFAFFAKCRIVETVRRSTPPLIQADVENEIINFFGYGSVAKELYRAAKMDVVQWIE